MVILNTTMLQHGNSLSWSRMHGCKHNKNGCYKRENIQSESILWVKLGNFSAIDESVEEFLL
jgi:hypothetical protein